MRIDKFKIEVTKKLKDSLVHLHLGHVAAQVKPPAVAKDHVVGLNYTGQLLSAARRVIADEPLLRPKDVDVVTVDGFIVTVYTSR